MKLHVKNGITIPKKYITENIYKKIKTDLIIINPAYITCIEYGKRPVYKTPSGKYVPIPKMLNFLKEYKDRLEVPRGYYYKLLEIFNQDIELEYQPCVNVKELLSENLTNIDLFDYQIQATQDMLEKQCGILCSPAASGKTIIGINIIAKLGYKTLWLVHLDRLMKQANESFLKVTNCKEEDLGIISEGNCKIGKVFTSAIIDTARKYSKQLSKEGFGTVIIDECHRTPTKKVYDVLMKLAPNNLYGLSATPYRVDGLDTIMKHMLGSNITQVEREPLVKIGRIITPKVEIIYTDILIKTDSLASSYQDFIKALIDNRQRNIIIIYEVLKEAIKGNICLLLSDRVSHCAQLYKMLSKVYEAVEIVSGRTKKKEADKVIDRLKAKEIPILITTYQFLGEGFDIPLLNRLFFCTPFKAATRCEQAIGRIQRTYEDNKEAKLYDFVDNNRLVKIQLNNRLDVYDKIGCDVSFRKSDI